MHVTQTRNLTHFSPPSPTPTNQSTKQQIEPAKSVKSQESRELEVKPKKRFVRQTWDCEYNEVEYPVIMKTVTPAKELINRAASPGNFIIPKRDLSDPNDKEEMVKVKYYEETHKLIPYYNDKGEKIYVYVERDLPHFSPPTPTPTKQSTQQKIKPEKSVESPESAEFEDSKMSENSAQTQKSAEIKVKPKKRFVRQTWDCEYNEVEYPVIKKTVTPAKELINRAASPGNFIIPKRDLSDPNDKEEKVEVKYYEETHKLTPYYNDKGEKVYVYVKRDEEKTHHKLNRYYNEKYSDVSCWTKDTIIYDD